MKKILMLLIALAATACSQRMNAEQQARDEFISTSADIGVYNGAQATFVLEKTEHQQAVNKDRLSYRIQTDDQSVYLMLTLSDAPKTISQKLSIAVQSLAVEGVETKTYNVEYKKLGSEKMWFWSKDDLVGFVIPTF